MMKGLVFASAALTALGITLPAPAADRPPAPYYKAPAMAPAPVYNWAGFYIGGNVGYGWGSNSSREIGFTDPTGMAFSPYFAAGGNVFPNVSPRGVVGGGQFGYDWQVSNWVYGFVVDFQAADVKASGTAGVTPPGFPFSAQSLSEKLDFFGTVRGKLGLAFNNWLVYGAGGFAYGDVQSTINITVPAVPASVVGSNSETRSGWAAGAGINYGITRSWNIGVEYLHYDLGRAGVSGVLVAPGPTPPGLSLTASQLVAGDIVRGLINYRF